jgi:ABC-type transporter Mla MlaB component
MLMSETVHQEAPDLLRLSGIVSLDTVVDYRDRIVEMLNVNSAEVVTIDLRDVEIHGSAILTLLISLARESRKLQKKVIFHDCPQDLLAVAHASGVSKILELT